MGKYLGDVSLYLATEQKAIIDMLDRTNFNAAKAARLFKVCRKTFYRKMRKHCIVVVRTRANKYERPTKHIEIKTL